MEDEWRRRGPGSWWGSWPWPCWAAWWGSASPAMAARADLDRAQADLQVARLSFDRAKRMRAEKLIPDQQYDQAEADFKMKQAAVDAQRRRIRQQEALLASTADDVKKTVVVAPMN